MRFYTIDRTENMFTLEEIFDRYFYDPSDFEDTSRADDELNECYSYCTISGTIFAPAEILYNCDENAYREYVYDEASQYLESLKEDIKFAVERLEKGESETFDGYTITFEYDDDDTDEDEDDTNEELCDLIA